MTRTRTHNIKYMAGKIQTMIPQYGELNRIYRDYIDNYAFLLTGRNSYRISIRSIMTWNPLKPLSLNWCLTSKRAIHLDTQQPENWNRKEHTGLWDTPVKWQSHRTCLLSAHGKVFSGNWSPAGCYKKSEQAAEWSQQQVWFHWLQGAYSRRGKQAEKEYERCKAEYDREKPNWTNSMISKRLQEQRHSNTWRTVVRTYTVKAAFSGYIEEIHSWRKARE